MRSLTKILGFSGFILMSAFWGIDSANALPDLNSVLNKNERIELSMNESHVLRLNQPATEVSIVNPEIAVVRIINPDEILINAISVGQTSLVIFYEGKKNENRDIVVKWNIEELNEVFQQTIPNEAIKVISLKNGIALTGSVSSAEAVSQAVELASSISPKIINLLTVPGHQQIMLKVKVAEVARNFREELGINFLVTNKDGFGGNLLGNLISGDYGTAQNTDVELSDAVSLFFGLPNDDVFAFVQAMKSKGLIHILAEPNLLARSGETATFLAGGEYPIPVVQSGQNSSITIEYKEYGVRLEFTPTIVEGETIRLDISPEVSDLDFANGVTMSGYIVPALVSRRAHTVIQMDAGQTFAIAGMINQSRTDTKKKVPLLGDVPMLGNLFKNSQKNIKETELLIMVTPFIVKPLKSDEQKIVPENMPNIDDLYEFQPPKKSTTAGDQSSSAVPPVQTENIHAADIHEATSSSYKPPIDNYSAPSKSQSSSSKYWMMKGK